MLWLLWGPCTWFVWLENGGYGERGKRLSRGGRQGTAWRCLGTQQGAWSGGVPQWGTFKLESDRARPGVGLSRAG